MLDELLEKCFNEDKAASGSESEAVTQRIKTNVLLRIEREKPMKHYGIKAVVIAAAMMIGGLMTVLFTANASTSGGDSSISSEEDIRNDPYFSELEEQFGTEGAVEHIRHNKEQNEFLLERTDELKAEALANGKIIIEKELDETDVVGYVPPRNMHTSHGFGYHVSDEELELVRRIEEEPESLGLIPVGKSETFEGGYRIVNRHFENINEPIDGEKTYYSFRRVYSDDEENRLIASSYYAFWHYIGPRKHPDWSLHDGAEFLKIKMDIFLDHTEEGCVADDAFYSPTQSTGMWKKDIEYSCLYLKPYIYINSGITVQPGAGAVALESVIYVTDDHVQLLD